MAGKNPTPVGVSDNFRRKFDVADYKSDQSALIQEKIEEYRRNIHGGSSKIPEGDDAEDKNVKREPVKPREYKVDLESKLGKTQVVTLTTPASQQGGYYCNVCDCTVKDSINFLDHINGRKHQRNLGMSMRVQRSTVDDVKKRLEALKRKNAEVKKDYDIEERMREIKEEEEKMKSLKKESHSKEKKLRLESDEIGETDVDPDFAALMGFSGFSSKKS